MKLTTRNVALTAIFAALYVILSLVSPHIPALGASNITISLEAMMASIFGLVVGPYLGALSALLGAFTSWAAFGGMSPYNLPFLLSPPINAMVTGFIYYKKYKWGFTLFGLLIIAFLFTPPVQPLTVNYVVAIAVLFDKIIALFLIIPLVIFAKQLSAGKAALFYFILGFIGNQADNMWGSFIFATPVVYGQIFSMPVEAVRVAFLVSPFAYPAIRLIQAFIAMIIAVPLMRILKGTPWLWQKETILSPYQNGQQRIKNDNS